MDIEALATVIAIIRRDWGYSGYSVTEVVPSLLGGGTVTVRHSDGSSFVVAVSRQGDRWGHGETVDAAWDNLLAKVAA